MLEAHSNQFSRRSDDSIILLGRKLPNSYAPLLLLRNSTYIVVFSYWFVIHQQPLKCHTSKVAMSFKWLKEYFAFLAD